MKIKTRVRVWCFALNNFADDEVVHLRGLSSDPLVRYFVLQEEVGKSGTPHLQGYVELFRPVFMSRVKRLLGARVHIEQRFGSQAEAIAYSKKVDTRVAGGVVIEFGTPARCSCFWIKFS